MFAHCVGLWTVIMILLVNYLCESVIFVMGVIDYRDESTPRSATVVYILRVLNESII